MTNTEKTINNIRAFMHKNEWTRYRMCKEAGLNVCAMRDLFTDDWSPRSDTLKKIERVIERFNKQVKK